jgi:hypothetical protein
LGELSSVWRRGAFVGYHIQTLGLTTPTDGGGYGNA